jgi:8-oxo-dGTP pyrophosphatase MutT (NUDIX family)
MWLMTTIGFFSVVQKPGTDFLTVRSRVRGDLDALRSRYLPDLSKSIDHAGTDYPWRATVPHLSFSAAIARMVSDIDYGNFKNEISARQGKGRAKRYQKVWEALYDLPDDTEPKAHPALPWLNAPTGGKKVAYGGIVFDPQGRILIREPKNHFDGYVWTFAKGRPEKDETPETAAQREVKEETGIDGRILAPIPEEFLGGTTINRYFVMQADPDSGEARWDNEETESVQWVLPNDAKRLISQTTNETGKKRDLAVLKAAISLYLQVSCSQLPPSKIIGGPASKTSLVTSDQADMLVKAINNLERAFQPNFRRNEEFSLDDFSRFQESAEYRGFIEACFVGGFVCTDYDHFFPLGIAHAIPDDVIPKLPFPALRFYIHTLQRAEKWQSEYSTALYEAVRTGALGLAARRIESLSQD